eukprot:TRINITY_DN4962_c0_g1_i1.p1 TRINITY_DN4962_c0_g1~~TRINITY_DN4962_c0_g1_i1.p1  ORF type:complete len:1017 (+),score=227.48 TRINITY_DN4962_c0_g1_i1:60-3110(+)
MYQKKQMLSYICLFISIIQVVISQQTISTCTTISSPGIYNVYNITADSLIPCIIIRSSNVTLTSNSTLGTITCTKVCTFAVNVASNNDQIIISNISFSGFSTAINAASSSVITGNSIAVNAGINGSGVSVSSGSYNISNNFITLYGVNDSYGIQITNTSYGNVYNNTIESVTSTGGAAYGIYVSRGNYLQITSNKITDISTTTTSCSDGTPSIGIYVEESALFVVNNTIDNVDGADTTSILSCSTSSKTNFTAGNAYGILLKNSIIGLTTNDITNITGGSATVISSNKPVTPGEAYGIMIYDDSGNAIYGIYTSSISGISSGNPSSTTTTLASAYGIFINLKYIGIASELQYNKISEVRVPSSGSSFYGSHVSVGIYTSSFIPTLAFNEVSDISCVNKNTSCSRFFLNGVVSNICADETNLCYPKSGCCNNTCQIAVADTVCRAAQGICDQSEICDGMSTQCPADKQVEKGTTCRPSAGACDISETCDGSNDDCPKDKLAMNETVCRASNGPCDAIEVCNGVNPACPPDQIYPGGGAHICRDSVGPCDSAEYCDGFNISCPSFEEEKCPPSRPCGDGICSSSIGENCVTCPYDCGFSSSCNVCGDGECTNSIGENCTTCSEDCGGCIVSTEDHCRPNISSSKEPVDICSGNGACVNGVCKCDSEFTGAFCSSKIQAVTVTFNKSAPSISLSVPTANKPSSSSSPIIPVAQKRSSLVLSSPSFSIDLSQISERDSSGSVLFTQDLSDFAHTFQQTESLQTTEYDYAEFSQNISNRATIIFKIWQIKERAVNFTIANTSVVAQAGTLKMNVRVNNWPFFSIKNTLYLDFRSSAFVPASSSETEEEDSCGNPIPKKSLEIQSQADHQGALQWVQTSISGYSMYASFVNQVEIDGRRRVINWTNNNTAGTVSAILPHFWDFAEVDPNYSVLLNVHEDPTSSSSEKNCGTTTSPPLAALDDHVSPPHSTNKTTLIIIVVVVGGVAVVAAIVGAILFTVKKRKVRKSLRSVRRGPTTIQQGL